MNQLNLENNEYDKSKSQIKCPKCDFEYVHPVFSDVKVVDGKDDNQASPYVRGSVITVPMFCEHGHAFEMKIGFHKGGTFLWTEELADIWTEETPSEDVFADYPKFSR